MKKIAAAAALVLAMASTAFAQQTVTEPITGVRITIVASVGDPLTLPAITARDTVISQASSMCNLASQSAAAAPLVNPKFLAFDDPYNAGRMCAIPFPTGLNEGSYRAVAQFLTAAASCDVGGVTRTPCLSDRSAAAIPPFSIANVRIAPGAPTGAILTK